MMMKMAIIMIVTMVMMMMIAVKAMMMILLKMISCCSRNLTDPGTLQACQSAEFTAYNFANTFDKQIYFDQV